MKTVVRLLIAAGIVFTAVFLTSACKDDDKDDQTTIIGTWLVKEFNADVTLNATATQSKDEVEAAIVNYLKVAVNSRVTFNNRNVSLAYSVGNNEPQNATLEYTLNDGHLSLVLPINSPKNLLGDVDLSDNTLKVNFTPSTFVQLLNYLKDQDPESTFAAAVNQISQANLFYRLTR